MNVLLTYYLFAHLSVAAISFRTFDTKPKIARAQLICSFAKSPKAIEIEGWQSTFYDEFISKYWQKRPLLIRNAFPDIHKLVRLDTNDFFSLVCDEDVDSRIFRRRGKKVIKEYGPFSSEYLLSLPADKWSILIQEMDRHIPQVSDLWETGFDFIPSWRRDDIMISYSQAGGSIGAHVDNYDVFLLQGSGKREWAIENSFLTEQQEKNREVPHSRTRLLRDFRADQSWEMQSGDMLYLPPRVPHRGTTLQGPCTTISIGFRAPNYQSLVTALWAEICDQHMSEDTSFYSDVKDLKRRPASIGRIEADARNTMKSDIRKQFDLVLNNPASFNDWLGKHLTAPLRYRKRKPSAFFLCSSTEIKQKLAEDVREQGHPLLALNCSGSLTSGEVEVISEDNDISTGPHLVVDEAEYVGNNVDDFNGDDDDGDTESMAVAESGLETNEAYVDEQDAYEDAYPGGKDDWEDDDDDDDDDGGGDDGGGDDGGGDDGGGDDASKEARDAAEDGKFGEEEQHHKQDADQPIFQRRYASKQNSTAACTERQLHIHTLGAEEVTSRANSQSLMYTSRAEVEVPSHERNKDGRLTEGSRSTDYSAGNSWNLGNSASPRDGQQQSGAELQSSPNSSDSGGGIRSLLTALYKGQQSMTMAKVQVTPALTDKQQYDDVSEGRCSVNREFDIKDIKSFLSIDGLSSMEEIASDKTDNEELEDENIEGDEGRDRIRYINEKDCDDDDDDSNDGPSFLADHLENDANESDCYNDAYEASDAFDDDDNDGSDDHDDDDGGDDDDDDDDEANDQVEVAKAKSDMELLVKADAYNEVDHDNNADLSDTYDTDEDGDSFEDYEEEDGDYDDINDDDLLPFAVRSKHSVASPRTFSDAEALLVAVLCDEVALRRAEGQRIAYIDDVIYIDGEAYPMPRGIATREIQHAAALLCDSKYINAAQLSRLVSATKPSAMNRYVVGLLRSGIFYPVDPRRVNPSLSHYPSLTSRENYPLF